MKNKFAFALFVVLLFVFRGVSFAALAIDTLGETTTNKFQGFTGSGFSPTPSAGQLNSDSWRITGLSDGDGAFGGTFTSGDFARGSDGDGVTTGGIYAFDIGGGNMALGVQPGENDFTPGSLTLKLRNDSGQTITDLTVSYDIAVLNNALRANSFSFSHSSNDNDYTTEASLNFISAEVEDSSPSWSIVTREITLTGLSVVSGSNYYLQWTGDDAGGSGSRDELALDNIAIKAVPEPATLILLAIGGLSCLAGRRIWFP